MNILKALYYQYYWWQKKNDANAVFVPFLTLLSILTPVFGIIAFVAIYADVIGIISLRNYDIKSIIWGIFFMGLTILWCLFLKDKRYKIIIERHNLYNKNLYKIISIAYPLLSALLFFIGAYIGYIHNKSI